MKTIIQSTLMACFAGMCIGMASCTDDALIEVSNSYKGKPFELTVNQEGPSSRLELGSDGLTTTWEAGDKLVMVDKTRTLAPIYLTCTSLTDNNSKATFSSETGVPAGNYWVLYNYNENMVYGHQQFQTISEINEKDKLVLWGELNIVDGTYKASIELKHLYAKVNVVLKNAPANIGGESFQVGMYSSNSGFPILKQFTNSGLVNAEYGTYFNTSTWTNEWGYFPSEKKYHNIRLGGIVYNNATWDETTGSYVTNDEDVITESALILPTDLSQETLYFYVIRGWEGSYTCYELTKEKKANFKAGVSYTVELDLNEAVVSTLSGTQNNETWNYEYELSTPAQCRFAAYWNQNWMTYKIMNDIDFENDVFFPFAAGEIKGNKYKLSNISLDWEENNVGMIKREWSHVEGEVTVTTINPMDASCKISDLTLENVKFSGKSYVGAFGGYSIYTNNCKVIGSSEIKGTGDYVGGIVGWSNLLNSSACSMVDTSVGQSCVVSGVNYVGGLVGSYMQSFGDGYINAYSSIILMESCSSSASVTGSGNYVGGLFGKVGGNTNNNTSTSISFSMEDYTFSLLKCQNDGTVTGKNYVGGIGGDLAITAGSSSGLDRVVLKQSKSEGNVSGDNFVGGLLGSSMASINTCYSIGTISATTTDVGGIVGYMDGMMAGGARIANCYSLATLTVGTNGYAGGIIGNSGMGSSVVNSYFGGVNATNCGIVGYSSGYCRVTNCLTTLSSLGTNLGQRIHKEPTGAPDNDNDGKADWDWNGDNVINDDDLYYTYDRSDIITNSEYSVTSILAKKTVINGDNAYSDNYWDITKYPGYCVKFADFALDTDSPDYGTDTI